ncbi:MAG: TetR/AcrR family transcriptional regulator [Betaproteobacteria bacterium]|nr:MAG: TetR/AcrR family transcriptional regulator [Betaproteobacteria bacterium]
MTNLSRVQATAARREQLLEAALHCFVVKGFHQTSMRDIAAQAGVSLGSLYNHFDSKSALIAEIAQMESTELAPLEAQLTKQPGRSGLLRFARDYAALHQDSARLMLGAEVLSELLRHPELATPFLVTRHRLVQALAAALEHARAHGELAQGMAAPDLAGLLLDAIEGWCFVDALARGQTPAMRMGGSLLKLIEALLAPAHTGLTPKRA